MSSSPPSSAKMYKQMIRRLFEEAWSQADFSHIREFIAPQLIFHIRDKSIHQTSDSVMQIIQRWKTAFPDLRFEIAEVIVEGHLAAARVLYQGTHRAEWKGIPPTGKKITVQDMMFFRFEADRIVEVWEVADEYSQLQQLTSQAG